MIMFHNYIILEIYFDQYMALSDAKESWAIYMVLLIYFLKHIIMSGLEMKNQLIQEGKVIKKNLQIYLTCPVESDEEVNEGKGLKILITNKLIRLPISLAQIKAGENSYKLKNEIWQIHIRQMYLLYTIIKPPKRFTII